MSPTPTMVIFTSSASTGAPNVTADMPSRAAAARRVIIDFIVISLRLSPKNARGRHREWSVKTMTPNHSSAHYFKQMATRRHINLTLELRFILPWPCLDATLHRPVENIEGSRLRQLDRIATRRRIDDGHVPDQVALAAVDLEVAQGVRNVA